MSMWEQRSTEIRNTLTGHGADVVVYQYLTGSNQASATRGKGSDPEKRIAFNMTKAKVDPSRSAKNREKQAFCRRI
ncbi:hypothetical protein [Nocardiopsis terrae]|uniref:hypothetical protein n=1 Tax=Nocardiopsis terrae TaxID=372655 RepID=UPI00174A5D5B|nr:hypothetical protein [Nocardiopsis terrae]